MRLVFWDRNGSLQSWEGVRIKVRLAKELELCVCVRACVCLCVCWWVEAWHDPPGILGKLRLRRLN